MIAFIIESVGQLKLTEPPSLEVEQIVVVVVVVVTVFDGDKVKKLGASVGLVVAVYELVLGMTVFILHVGSIDK